MSSLSQEEFRSISENVKWGQRKRFADGKTSVAFSRFLGYDQDEDGNWVINEEEAETVREIYRLFLEGLSGKAIANRLTAEGKPTPGGQKEWNPGTVNRMLQNEKYKGDALLQKFAALEERYRKAEAACSEAEERIRKQGARNRLLGQMIRKMKELEEPINEFDADRLSESRS